MIIGIFTLLGVSLGYYLCLVFVKEQTFEEVRKAVVPGFKVKKGGITVITERDRALIKRKRKGMENYPDDFLE